RGRRPMPETHPPSDTPSLAAAKRIDALCDRFEAAWRAGAKPRIEDLLAEVPEAERPALFVELLRLDCDLRRPACSPEQSRARFPDYVVQIDTVFRVMAPDLPRGAGRSCAPAEQVDVAARDEDSLRTKPYESAGGGAGAPDEFAPGALLKERFLLERVLG